MNNYIDDSDTEIFNNCMEIKEVKTYVRRFICPQCKKERMSYTGYTLLSNPAWYEHDCKCGYQVYLRRRYPYTFHKDLC